MIKIKNILNDLVDFTYEDSEKLQLYKKFYVELIDKVLKTKHGDYFMPTHRIRIFNLYRNDAAIVATTIHELAHHIDNMNRGTSDHSKEFYVVFKELLYRALDMQLFSKEEFLEANRDASDSNKIAKMISEYLPKETGYKKDLKNIEVTNGFLYKELLKSRGYKWNGINKVWEKEFSYDEIEAEEQFLTEKRTDIYLKQSHGPHFPQKNVSCCNNRFICGKE